MQLFWARLRNRMLRLRLWGRDLAPLAARNLSALDHLRGSAPALAYRYVVLDLETTGLDLGSDQVVSMGAVVLEYGRIRLAEAFYELINPGRDVPAAAVKIHGISPGMLAEARSLEQAWDDFLAFLGTGILVAHHARFDLHFLNQAMRRIHGFALQNLVIDTALLFRQAASPGGHFPHHPGTPLPPKGMDQLAEHMNLELADRHTAYGDAMTAAMVFQRYLMQNERGRSGSLRSLIWAAGLI